MKPRKPHKRSLKATVLNKKVIEDYSNCVALHIADDKWAIIDADNYEFLSQFKWHVAEGYASRCPSKYCDIRSMHRFVAKTPKGMDTDHINGNRLDNRRSNLRVLTRGQNVVNRGKNLKTQSKYKGVAYDKRVNKWYARITINYKFHHIGCFSTEIEAAEAYNAAALFVQKDLARLNVI